MAGEKGGEKRLADLRDEVDKILQSDENDLRLDLQVKGTYLETMLLLTDYMEAFVTMQSEKKAYVSLELLNSFKETLGLMRLIAHSQSAEFTASAMSAMGMIADYKGQLSGKQTDDGEDHGLERNGKEDEVDVILDAGDGEIADDIMMALGDSTKMQKFIVSPLDIISTKSGKVILKTNTMAKAETIRADIESRAELKEKVWINVKRDMKIKGTAAGDSSEY